MGSREKEQAGGVRSPGDIAACPGDVSAQAGGVHFGTCTVIVIVRDPSWGPFFYSCLRAAQARRPGGPPDLPACIGASVTPLRPCSAPCVASTRLDRHGISLREKHRVHLCCRELGIVRSDLGHDTSRPTSLRAYSSSLPSCGAWAGRAGSFSSCIVVARSVDPGVSCVGFRPLDLKRNGEIIGVDVIGRAPCSERQARLPLRQSCVELCLDWYGVPRPRILGFVEGSRVAVFGHSIAR